jgi:hypothetical protein
MQLCGRFVETSPGARQAVGGETADARLEHTVFATLNYFSGVAFWLCECLLVTLVSSWSSHIIM